MTAPKGLALKIKPTIYSEMSFFSANNGKNGFIIDKDEVKIKKLNDRIPNI
jgi:hypothetical protein